MPAKQTKAYLKAKTAFEINMKIYYQRNTANLTVPTKKQIDEAVNHYENDLVAISRLPEAGGVFANAIFDLARIAAFRAIAKKIHL